MPDNLELYVADIRSNTDKLSAMSVHDTLVNMVRSELLMGEAALKSFVPKRDGDMEAKAGHKGPYDKGEEITGHVGIPEIHKAGESDAFSGIYPIFVDKGTGIFGDTSSRIFPKDKEKEFMHLPPERGGGIEYPEFLRSSKGQKAQHFTAATFAEMAAMLKINGKAFRAELTSKLKAEKLT